MKYFVTLNGRTWEIGVNGARVTVDGKEHHAELRPIEATPLRLLLLDGATWQLAMESGGRGIWNVLVQGEQCEVQALDERAAHIRSLVGVGAAHAGPLALKAPMPGLVVRITAREGQRVAAGESLVVLEAMKMENELKAAAPGVIARVAVTAGQTVEKGDVLVSFDSGVEQPPPTGRSHHRRP
jgi:biotin carboxyl carrier protein